MCDRNRREIAGPIELGHKKDKESRANRPEDRILIPIRNLDRVMMRRMLPSQDAITSLDGRQSVTN
jgi:hypothetical protein